ncbi:MAG: iron-sulfur cluster assembly scaffold protein [Nanoarchaeota archaeon]|nr:iron-sulfur cluster assembly scaffold protein [Nanoarchaeota archaeon]
MAKACLYTNKALEYFKHPKHAGEIKNPDAVATAGNPRCGDVLKFFLKIKNNKIVDIRFKTYGCLAAIASSEALARMAKGKTLSQALKIKDSDIVKHLGGLPTIKFHCSVLGSTVLKKAIESYKKTKTK